MLTDQGPSPKAWRDLKRRTYYMKEGIGRWMEADRREEVGLKVTLLLGAKDLVKPY